MRLFATLLISLPLVLEAKSPLSRGISDFALQLSSDLEFKSNNAATNYVWSPFSTHAAFAQVLLGAGGITQAEMESVLGISKATTAEYGPLVSAVKSGNSTLKIGNLLAIGNGFKPKAAFTQNMQSRFKSTLLELDFKNNPSGSVNQINNFVAEKTANKIEKLLASDQVDEDTKMVLVNAIYFKALWQSAFDTRNTIQSQFDSPTGPVDASFMNQNIKAHVLETDTLRILELPYQDASKSLLLILPVDSNVTNIIDLARSVDFPTIRTTPKMSAQVMLPRFKIKRRTQLKPLMQSVGMKSVFANSANLQGISDDPIAVDDAVHEAIIEVTEEGTEAAAATAVILGLRIATRSIQFALDRPFAFVVYDFAQEVPLFIGKVNNPMEVGTRTGSLAASQSGTTAAPGRSAQSTTSQPTENVCDSQRMNLPNALNNVDLCKQAESTKMFDWLRSYRTVCEESNRTLNSFKENNCVMEWCEYAKAHIQEWMDQKRSCAGRQLDPCRTNDNRVAAYQRLNCVRK